MTKDKNKVGRPAKITPEIIAKLEEIFALGGTDEEACFYAEIGKSTLYNYQDVHPEFVERKEALKENPILKARRSVVGALEGDPDMALKFLERKRKDEFSPRSTVDFDVKDKEGIKELTEFFKAVAGGK